MTTITPSRLADIEARVATASLTPEIAPCVVNGVRHSGSCASLNTPANHVSRSNCNCGAYRPYAEFYRDDIPALLADRAALAAEVERLKQNTRESDLVRLARPPAPDGNGTTVGTQSVAQPTTKGPAQ